MLKIVKNLYYAYLEWRHNHKQDHTPKPGHYRVMITDVAGEEVEPGIVSVVLYMTIAKFGTVRAYDFEETIIDYKDNPRADEYFNFLLSTGCSMEEFHDVVGMVFDADLVLERIGGETHKIFTNRKLVALPVVTENV